MVSNHTEIRGDLFQHVIELCSYGQVVIEYIPEFAESVAWLVGRLDLFTLENLKLYKLEETYISSGVDEVVIL